MNADDRARMMIFQNDLEQVQKDIGSMRSDMQNKVIPALNALTTALKGNDLGDEGMVSRIRKNEEAILRLDQTIKQAKWTIIGISLGLATVAGGAASIVVKLLS